MFEFIIIKKKNYKIIFFFIISYTYIRDKNKSGIFEAFMA